MTSNRDALRAPYDGAFQSFLDDLSVDVRSAMKDQEDRKHVRIEGGLGKLRAKRDVMEIADAMAFVTAPSRSEERRVGKRVSVRVDLGGCRNIKKKKLRK